MFTQSFYWPLRVRVRPGLGVLPYTMYASNKTEANLPRDAGLGSGISGPGKGNPLGEPK